MSKGVVMRIICQNPSCTHSANVLEKKSALNVTKSTGKVSFEIPQTCPLCKSNTELLSFISGSVSIEPDTYPQE